MDMGEKSFQLPFGVTIPVAYPTIVVANMPNKMPPGTFIAKSTTVKMIPATARRTMGLVKSLRVTKVASLSTIMPALFKPIKAMKRPIPLGIAFFKFDGMDFNIASLTLKKEKIINKIPSKNTAVKATSTLYFIVITTVKVKKALSPMPGANAIGRFAKTPMSKLATAADTAVAVKTAPLSSPAIPNSSGFTARM